MSAKPVFEARKTLETANRDYWIPLYLRHGPMWHISLLNFVCSNARQIVKASSSIKRLEITCNLIPQDPAILDGYYQSMSRDGTSNYNITRSDMSF
jgi:hypothetical protein